MSSNKRKVIINDPEGCFYNGDVATILHTYTVAGVNVHWLQVRGNTEFAMREEHCTPCGN